ncbi:hypothetical protein SAMN04488107_2903 [Geodermatophilus saharensis]|uniref:5,10-methylene-tetrahydrofolate dehydrogenase/Methenyl tetrahydrofolate cyclohydrolase n=1 Tax=Geodermatophilus saharensis TaxID=1137994 RepID=A0A239F9B7_9ACTN|nr:hypothetical protein [Geodermatophilus saharensis]SNS53331.1 hypothetical protein SAMN04488107_2903 [Geodermatophilus saharensis]
MSTAPAGDGPEAGATARPDVVVGLVAAPGVPAEVADELGPDLAAALRGEHPEVAWDVRVVEDGLVAPPADDAEIVAAARERLLAEEWDLAVCVTDLPLTVARRTVVGHASPVHGVAVLSLPALGAVGRRRRALQTSLGLVRALLGDDGGDPGVLRRRLRELAADQGDAGGGFTARVLTGNLRLLVGMVRANRPWRLTASLSRALAAAVAAGVFALVTSDIWRLADRFGPVRLVAVGLGSVVAICATLVVGARLWERAGSPRVRKQVALFNLATVATVVLGVLTLYAALFTLALTGALLLVPSGLFAEGLGHRAGLGDYLELAWLTSSLATVGGALDAGLEEDEAVREAAYTHRPGAGG